MNTLYIPLPDRQSKNSKIVAPWMLKQVQHDGCGDVDAMRHRHPELVSGSIPPLAQSQRCQPKADSQIMPIGVFAFNQIDLPLPVPVFEPLFAGDGGFHIAEKLISDEAVGFVSAGKAGNAAFAVLPQALDKVGGDTDIDGPVWLAGEDIDAGLALELHGIENAGKWMLKQVQHDDCDFS